MLKIDCLGILAARKVGKPQNFIEHEGLVLNLGISNWQKWPIGGLEMLLRGNYRMKQFCVWVFCLAVLVVWVGPGVACTSFVIKDKERVVFGKSYDWELGDAIIFVNKRDVSKSGRLGGHLPGRPANWISIYGSLTFNQYGREFPTGGINQAGLVVEVMVGPGLPYPPPDARPYVGSVLQWGQYILDTCASIKDVLAADAKVRIPSEGLLGVHFFISDKTGNCTSVEFLNGRTVFHTGPTMPVKALTNSTYASSIKAWKSGPKAVDIAHDDSIRRFKFAADMVSRFDKEKIKPAIEYAFDVLYKVERGRTQWQIVYDITNSVIFLKTKNNTKLRLIDTRNFDYSCASTVMMLNIDAGSAGDVTDRFTPYTRQANRRLIGRSFQQTYFTKDIPTSILDRRADYPDNTTCD